MKKLCKKKDSDELIQIAWMGAKKSEEKQKKSVELTQTAWEVAKKTKKNNNNNKNKTNVIRKTLLN